MSRIKVREPPRKKYASEKIGIEKETAEATLDISQVSKPSELEETHFLKVEDNFNKTKPKKSTSKRKLSSTLKNDKIVKSPRKKRNSKKIGTKKEPAKSRKITSTLKNDEIIKSPRKKCNSKKIGTKKEAAKSRKITSTLKNDEIIKSPRKKCNSKKIGTKKEAVKSRKITSTLKNGEIIKSPRKKCNSKKIGTKKEAAKSRKITSTLKNDEIIKSPRKKCNSKKIGRKKGAAKSRKITPKKSASKRKLSNPLDIFEVSKPLKIEADGEVSSKIAEESAEPLMYKKLISGGYSCKICMEKYHQRHKMRLHIELKHGPPKTYECDDCGKVYKTKFQISLHMIWHRENSNGSTLCCDKCDFIAKTKYYLKTHKTRKHMEDYNFKCDYCNKRFKLKYDVKRHMSTHNKLQCMCDICGNLYHNSHALGNHRRVAHINEYKYRCEVCGQKLLTEENLKIHMKSHENPFECRLCDLKFRKKHYLVRHTKRVHEFEKNHLCSACGKIFTCSSALRIHQFIHAKVKPYLCNVCGSRFTQRSSMMSHWKKKHPDAERPPPPVKLTELVNSIETEVH